MKKFENSIDIDKPIGEVFDVVADFERFPDWRTGLLDAKVTSAGPVGKGTTYLYDMKTMGKVIETSGLVEDYQPPDGYSWKSTSGPFPISGKIILEPVNGGTRLTERLEVDPGGFFKLAEPLMVKQQQRQMEKDLIQLKELLERQ